MDDREKQISALLANTNQKSRLLPSATQSSNVGAYARIHSIDFDLQSLSSKAHLITNDIKKLSKEVAQEDQSV